MKPLIDIASREYLGVQREDLAQMIDAIRSPLDWIEDERYLRAVVLLLLRAHLLDRPACLVAAARLLNVYKEERHERIH